MSRRVFLGLAMMALQACQPLACTADEPKSALSSSREAFKTVQANQTVQTNSGDDETNPVGSSGAKVEAVEEIEQLRVEVLASFPHDPNAFTQGLVWDGGVLYESTGLYGRSSVRRVDPATGRLSLNRMLDPGLFGEGLALVGDRLICLTWHAGVALVLELSALEVVDQFGYRGEGWGLAFDGERLVMSDGSDQLTFRDPNTFAVLSQLSVTEKGKKVDRLNELEVAEGQIYANLWQEEILVRIDPRTGKVNGRIDATGLLEPEERRRVDVMNGVAYDPVSKTFWITGKFWPKMFQVRFVPAKP